jgi:adenylate kinase family enzyme
MYLIRGLSGSGKTTLANAIVSDLPTRASICVDDFFVGEDGVYKFEPERLKEAHDWCVEEADLVAQDSYEVVVVHNTFTRKWEAEPYFKIAEKYGYVVQVVSLYDSGFNDRALSERCVHGISEKAIQTQRKRWDLDIYPHRNNRPRVETTQQIPMMVAYPPPHFYRNQGGGYMGHPEQPRQQKPYKKWQN